MFTKKTMVVLCLITISLVATACAPVSQMINGTWTPTPNGTLTAEAAAARETDVAIAAQQTKDAEATQAQYILETATQSAKEANQTQSAVERSERQTEAVVRLTSQAGGMFDRIMALFSQGLISRTNGKYTAMDDYTRSMAMLNYFTWNRTKYSPADFVVSADVKWESASDVANWHESGCGFVFRSDSSMGNYYVVFLMLNGWVEMWGDVNGKGRSLGSSYYGKLDVPSGKASMVLIADGATMRVLVNDKLVHTGRDGSLQSGTLSYTLISGTNKDYGIRCTMTNVELWELE